MVDGDEVRETAVDRVCRCQQDGSLVRLSSKYEPTKLSYYLELEFIKYNPPRLLYPYIAVVPMVTLFIKSSLNNLHIRLTILHIEAEE